MAQLHTDGIWTAREYATGTNYYNWEIISTKANTSIAQQLLECDARLIAAAPDLLEALKEAVKCVEYCRRAHKDVQSGDGMPVETSWKEIIAKAEGK